MKPTYEQLEQQLAAVVAENARCKFEISRCHQTVDEMFKNRDKWVDKEWLSSIWSTSKRLMNETPATDSYLAEAEARGVDKFATEIGSVYKQLRPNSNHAHALKSVVLRAVEFAAQLRQGAEYESNS